MQQRPLVAMLMKVDVQDDAELFENPNVQFDLENFFRHDHMNAMDDEPGEHPDAEKEDLEQYLAKVKRTPSGRFSAPMKWKLPKKRLQPNKPMVRRQLFALWKRLKNNPELFRSYSEALKKLEDCGIVEKVDSVAEGEPCVLMPHHPVVREDKETTKCRVVFNGSAPGVNGAPSLNQFLDPGPNLVPDILDVLLRWRMAPIVFSADIEQAFYQIELEAEDSNLIRFIWMVADEGSERIQEFRFKRAVMGLACSPFMLQAVIRKLMEEYQDRYPKTVELILKQLFVDDLLGCADTVESAKELIRTALEIFSSARLMLRKFSTNEAELRRFLEETKIDGMSEGILSKALDGATKTLGMKWNSFTDLISYAPEEIVEATRKLKSPTKRDITKISSRLLIQWDFSPQYR